MKLKNPLDGIGVSTSSILDTPEVKGAVSNDMPGVCPVCLEKMDVLNTGNDTNAYVCMQDRVCLPVEDGYTVHSREQ